MRAIPLKIRTLLSNDPFMEKCCLCGISGVKIEWHQAFIYQGRQQNDPTSILPLCETCHDRANEKSVKENLDRIMFARGLDPKDYPRSGLEQRKKYLCD